MFRNTFKLGQGNKRNIQKHQCKRAIKVLKGRRDDHSVATLKEEHKKLSEIYTQQEVF